jgi:putative transposase
MDEAHLRAALAYVALNPVRARLTARAQDWRWSSVHAHLSGRADGLTAIAPVLQRYPRFADLIEAAPDEEAFARLRSAETIGRLVGDDHFLAKLEARSGRSLRPAKPGPRPATEEREHGDRLSALSP